MCAPSNSAADLITTGLLNDLPESSVLRLNATFRPFECYDQKVVILKSNTETANMGKNILCFLPLLLYSIISCVLLFSFQYHIFQIRSVSNVSDFSKKHVYPPKEQIVVKPIVVCTLSTAGR